VPRREYALANTLPVQLEIESHWSCIGLCACAEQLVGLAAKQQMIKDPSNSVSAVKRFMGHTVHDDQLVENSAPVKVHNITRL